MNTTLTISTHDAISAVPAADWDRLAGGNPFVSHRFLAALEDSGSVGRGSGWQPLHLTVEGDGKILGAAPLYAKSHSQGEYIFDHAWADAYTRAAEVLGAECAYVGAAFHEIVVSHPEIELYDPDGSHPSYVGTCLAAMVMYKTVFGEIADKAESLKLDTTTLSVFGKVIG